ncbi:DUF4962 domain-containing protein [Cohnella hashimotonis]|uniref:DUF4962 domain-containing protein n=1 Tax=Cohnella hashimotonis TaxID=2826895 RepID=A0ABT6TA73_9BACL|nr:DUF4962 domain-containing protein [Cohnella hashimotonis]MDI4643731.1 DUF4962 domain-containing protein [Cohnella hashimotonis]
MENASKQAEAASEMRQPGGLNETAPAWPAELMANANLPFRPADALVTTQNPPDFDWPFVPGADRYRLELARNAAMDGGAIEAAEPAINFYNFAQALDEGIWFWRVRFHTPEAGWSAWSEVRRFRIAEGSVAFPVPPIDELLARMETGHPRVWTNPRELEAFRERRLHGVAKTVFENVRESVLARLGDPLPPDPTFPYMDRSISSVSPEWVKALQDLRKYADTALDHLLQAAFVYLITGDREIGEHAKAHLLNFASWDPEAATRFDINDQVHRAVAYRSTIAYDWLYDLLSPEERQAVQDMVRTRIAVLIEHYLDRQPIYQYPFDSHGWTIAGYIGLMGTIMLHDIPEAEAWVRRAVPAFINLLPPWGGEDGSWSQGTGYWQWSSGSNKELMDVLLSAGAIDAYAKAFSRHEGLYPIYMFPHGSPTGVFGNDSHYLPDWPSISLLNRLAQVYGDPRMQWAAEAIGERTVSGLQDYFYGDEGIAPRPPADLPKAKWFPTTGLVAMHSDLADPERISLYFKSSPYGSYSHSQADQNGFIIHAFGETLALKSGYYDYYNSVHHRGYTKRTYSANAITFDGRQGQPIDDFDAKGRMLGFATHPAFDAATGDAVAAYRGGELARALRHIVYIKPSVFVVIDDLAASDPDGVSFEWNLHADERLTLESDGGGATIEKDKVGLQVRLHGADSLGGKASIEKRFLDPDGNEATPVAWAAGKSQVHATFAMPKKDAAVLVASLAPYRLDGGAPEAIASTERDGYLRLSFAGGAVLFVRTAAEGPVDTGADGYRFDGAALAACGASLLLVHGTRVERDGDVVFESDVPATAAWGEGRLSASVSGDAALSLAVPGEAILRDGSTGREVPADGDPAARLGSQGVHWTAASGRLSLRLEQGQHAFRLDDAPLPGPIAPVTLPTEIDGASGETALEAWRDVDGDRLAWGRLVLEAGDYEVLEAPAGFAFARHGRIRSGSLGSREPVLLRGEPGLLKLRRIDATHSSP